MRSGASPRTRIRLQPSIDSILLRGELTADKLKDMTYREINGMGHSLGETLKYDFDDLKDNTTYSVAVVAVDRWATFLNL